jgi:tryptophan halogenase
VRDIVVVVGGTAGWMTAAALASRLSAGYRLQLVESDEIGTIGVGEATIPVIRHFNSAIGIDEDEFIRETRGTFKLGIEFVDWGWTGNRYVHGFGRLGVDLDEIPFHHWWLRMRAAGRARELAHYSINTAAPAAARFMRPRPEMAGSPLADIAYAFHFDASLYARYLRRHAEARGVQRIEGRIASVPLREPDGGVAAVVLDDGRRVDGDFFVDCSGLRGLLIEQTLASGYDDWTHWLPCDRAVAVPCESAGPLRPVTRSTAGAAGWRWRIPLQHRIGNGHVFCSRHLGEDEATAQLLAGLEGPALAAPRTIRFVTGRRRKVWNRNVVAVGLASDFLEPLESTSIHLIQTMISRLIAFFPHAGLDAADIEEFNRQAQHEFELIRDFIILHYHANRRPEAFWRERREMAVPESLQHRINLFRANGRVFRQLNEMFAELSWVQVLIGQGVLPRGFHPLAALRPEEEVAAFVDDVARVVDRCVQAMPLHADFVAAHCRATWH